VGGPLVVPRWLARLFYAVRGKRRVRYYLFDGKGGTNGPTLEGIEFGCWAGHYVIGMPQHIRAEEQSLPLQGMVEIARERVIYRQVLT
jgi:hypothetical protein